MHEARGHNTPDMKKLKPIDWACGYGGTEEADMGELSPIPCPTSVFTPSKSRRESSKGNRATPLIWDAMFPSPLTQHSPSTYTEHGLSRRDTQKDEVVSTQNDGGDDDDPYHHHDGLRRNYREGLHKDTAPSLRCRASAAEHCKSNVFPSPQFSLLLQPSSGRKKMWSSTVDTTVPLSSDHAEFGDETPLCFRIPPINEAKSSRGSAGQKIGRGAKSSHGLSSSFALQSQSSRSMSFESEWESVFLPARPSPDAAPKPPSHLFQVERGGSNAETSGPEHDLPLSIATDSDTVQTESRREPSSPPLGPNPLGAAGLQDRWKRFCSMPPRVTSVCSVLSTVTSPSAHVNHQTNAVTAPSCCLGLWRLSMSCSPEREKVAYDTTPPPASASILASHLQSPQFSRSHNDIPTSRDNSFVSGWMRRGTRSDTDDEEDVHQVAELVARMEGQKRVRESGMESVAGDKVDHDRFSLSSEMPALAAGRRGDLMTPAPEPHSARDTAMLLPISTACNKLAPVAKGYSPCAPTAPPQEANSDAVLGRFFNSQLENRAGEKESDPPGCLSSHKSSISTVEGEQVTGANDNSSFARKTGSIIQHHAGRRTRDVAASVKAVLATLEGGSASHPTSLRRGRSSAVNFCL